jgi:glycosyltransferase involved in cell wall biosynthesis
MVIGIDCRTILHPQGGEQAGIGHYTHYLVKGLLAQDSTDTFVLFFDHRVKDTGGLERFPNVRIRRFPFSRYKRFLPVTYSHVMIAAFLARENLDVFHAPANILPLSYRGTSVVTLHDLAIYRNPSWFPRQIFSTHLLVPQSLARADQIIAVSESTAVDIETLFNVPRKKISVIHEGVEGFPRRSRVAARVKKKFRIAKPYFLFVGTLEPRKNLPRVIQAYAEFVRREGELARGTEFLIAGGKGYRHEAVEEEIREMKVRSRVRLLGYVSHEEKVELMRGALAFVFPSLYEGFGLPVLEAMQVGTPVIASETSSLSEIVGRAGLLVNPENAEEISRAMGQLTANAKLRRDLARRGKTKAKQFSWEKTARETLKVYRKAARKKKK